MGNITKISVLFLAIMAASMSQVFGEGLSRAQTNYMLQCQGCHKASGTGMPPQTPDFHEHGRTFMHADAGRRYWISVPGAANSPLSDQELADVLNYIAQDIVKVSNHKPFTVDEVKRHRGEKMRDVYKVRQTLIDDLAPSQHLTSY